MTECKYCKFTDFDEDDIHAYGQDLIDVSVWLENNESTGEVVLVSDGWGDIKINYCPMCGRKLGD